MKTTKTHLTKKSPPYWPATACGKMTWLVKKTTLFYNKTDCIVCCKVHESRKK